MKKHDTKQNCLQYLEQVLPQQKDNELVPKREVLLSFRCGLGITNPALTRKHVFLFISYEYVQLLRIKIFLSKLRENVCERHEKDTK